MRSTFSPCSITRGPLVILTVTAEGGRQCPPFAPHALFPEGPAIPSLGVKQTIMALSFTLKQTSPIPLEVEGITPDQLVGKSVAEIEKLEMFHGNVKTPLGEFFRIEGDSADQVHHWHGNLEGVHWLGTKMTSGKVEVHSNIGRHVGGEMRGGEIVVHGNAGDWVGGEMHGGLIRILGNAGHLVGSAYRGSPKGMTKGTILVHGNVGNEVGHSMRRGLIAIGGNSGDLMGMNMLAGNIFVFGNGGIRHGAGMKRGTIAFLGSEHPPVLPTFRKSATFKPDFLQVLFRHLRHLEFPIAQELFTSAYDLYCGDLLDGGRGELLLRTLA